MPGPLRGTLTGLDAALSPRTLTLTFYAAIALYSLALLVTLVRPRWGRWPLLAGALVHSLSLIGRGLAIQFFPLTNKFESFAAASLAMAVVAAATWRPVRLFVVPQLLLAIAALGTALSFSDALGYPPPLMRTIWYPLHVPLSFLAYAVWAASAAAGLAWLQDRNERWIARIDSLALQGFGLWTLSMICGGFWGVVAWGAYFMWDPKIIWSVILWFHYASFIHLHLTPSLHHRGWVRAALAILGFVWVLVAYVGTSFFFGKSSHAFG